MRNLLFFTTLLCIALPTAAQSVYGRVLTTDRSPVVGAYVTHLNSEHHTHTNELGYFELDGVTPGDSLRVTYLGYRTQRLSVPAAGEELNVVMREGYFDLAAVTVRPSIQSLDVSAEIDARLRPVQNAQQVLLRVPGLIIGQHAGGGKAEQIFLRGFDIDHGTDVAIEVEGMPVNMVSHAHGQGYADLHFLIPETIDKIDYGKGPYYADQGNFATAGFVDFQLKESLDRSLIKAEYGSFNTLRTVGLFDLLDQQRGDAYLAAEYIMTDGPFESNQHFNRLNLMGRYSTELSGGSRLSVLASHFESKWDASGQIPVRAVEDGTIGRFGAIDDTEGGYTGRSNLAAEFTRFIDRNTFVTSNAYYSRYDFELFSNFTFFLEDPLNGDQIRQREEREIFGFRSELNHGFMLGDNESRLRAGLGLRYDNVDDVGLSRTRNRRELLEQLQLGEIDETNVFAYVGADLEFGNLLINPALRVDHFNFNYVDRLQTTYDRQEQRQTAVSPKLNFLLTVDERTQLFFKTGIGFHANDTRVVLDRSANEILPAAYGADLGGIFRLSRRLIVNAALWYLLLEQEFVYVGDAGIVEPSGRSRRLGVDLGLRYQLTDWLFANADVNYALARSIDEPEGADLIPLAPDLTSTAGLNVLSDRWTGSLRYRYLANRPANEDGSIVAEGYFVVDANISYLLGPVSLGIAVDNLTDTEWNETQFATASRLRGEREPVEEIHFTPGTPFAIRGIARYRF